MTRDQQIRRIKHTILDRLAHVLAVAVRRYPPLACHRYCPKAACRRARTCCRAGSGALADTCLGRAVRAQAERAATAAIVAEKIAAMKCRTEKR